MPSKLKFTHCDCEKISRFLMKSMREVVRGHIYVCKSYNPTQNLISATHAYGNIETLSLKDKVSNLLRNLLLLTLVFQTILQCSALIY